MGRVGVSIQYGSSNEEGAKAVQQLMSRRGYDVHLGPPSARGERRVSVRAASWERYARDVSSRIDYKRARLDEFLRRRTGRILAPKE